MSLIGNTYIDNLNIPESTSYDGLYGLGGVVLGFGLTFLYDYYKNKKEINKVGKSFESIIIDIKEKCKFQINHIEGYQKEIKTNKMTVLGIVFVYEQDPLSFIDKYKLFDYCYSLRKDESKRIFFNTNEKITEELIYKNINIAFNDIRILYLEIKSINDEVDRMTKGISLIIDNYITLFNQLAIEIADFKNKTGGNFSQDVLAVHLDNLITKHSESGFSINDLSSYKDSLHNLILLDTSYYSHPLYKLAFNFDSIGTQRIESIEMYYRQIDEFLDSKKESIKERYKSLYKEDITIKAAN